MDNNKIKIVDDCVSLQYQNFLGRMVLFDGAIYHASSNPVHSNYRTTVNFNFLGALKS